MFIGALLEKVEEKKKTKNLARLIFENDDFGNFTNFKVHFVFLKRFFWRADMCLRCCERAHCYQVYRPTAKQGLHIRPPARLSGPAWADQGRMIRFHDLPQNVTYIYYILSFFFLYIFKGFFVYMYCTSAAPQRPAHGTVSSQVATHLRTDSLLCAGEELDSNPGLLICSQMRYHWATSAPFEPPLLHIEPLLLSKEPPLLH